MEHMNTQFDEYRESGTAGKDICMAKGSSIFSDQIIQAYEKKGAEFFITNDFTILPIERFQKFFVVTAKYRIKRSGLISVGKSRFSPVLNYIKYHDYVMIDSRIDRGKLFIESNTSLHNIRFIVQQYEIRKLSNTYNANVIFPIKQKKN